MSYLALATKSSTYTATLHTHTHTPKLPLTYILTRALTNTTNPLTPHPLARLFHTHAHSTTVP
jgi:hypothetical protein